jgi:hypothetical protein
MQNQAPTSVVITHGSDRKITEEGSNTLVVGPSEPEPTRAAKLPPEPEPSPSPPSPTRQNPQSGRYREVVEAKQLDVNRCVSEHGQPPPGARVVIVVAPSGHARSISFEPVSVDDTPLGVCIRNVFKAMVFPRGVVDEAFNVKLVRRA